MTKTFLLLQIFFIILIDNLLRVHQNSINTTEYNTSCSPASHTIYITIKIRSVPLNMKAKIITKNAKKILKKLIWPKFLS